MTRTADSVGDAVAAGFLHPTGAETQSVAVLQEEFTLLIAIDGLIKGYFRIQIHVAQN